MLDPPRESLLHFIWRTHYRDAQAVPPEFGIEETWDRVARSVAAIEPHKGPRARSFRALLEGYRFRPAGRILAGAGVARQVTLANCFAMGLIDDSLPGIDEP